MNRLEEFRDIFAGITPWAGEVPKGFSVDFLGTLTDARLRPEFPGDPSTIGGRHAQAPMPQLDDMSPRRLADTIRWRGEGWFEVVNWFVATREARDRFVMITLGAWHGSQAVGSYKVLQRTNPMPCKLVAVEPVPENAEMVVRHFRTNGINPDEHWILPMAINGSTDPVFFAISSRRMGPQNCFSTNEHVAREDYFREAVAQGRTEATLKSLLLNNSTGIKKFGEGAEGELLEAEIKYVSAITLNELLGPFSLVDYLESDIQESEKLVFPPFMALLKRKVRRIHIGTHGRETHMMLCELFARDGWEIVFNYAPQTLHETALGRFRTEDGILTVRNRLL